MNERRLKREWVYCMGGNLAITTGLGQLFTGIEKIDGQIAIFNERLALRVWQNGGMIWATQKAGFRGAGLLGFHVDLVPSRCREGCP